MEREDADSGSTEDLPDESAELIEGALDGDGEILEEDLFDEDEGPFDDEEFPDEFDPEMTGSGDWTDDPVRM